MYLKFVSFNDATMALWLLEGARCSSVDKECWVIGSILHGGPIKPFLIPTSVPNEMNEGLTTPQHESPVFHDWCNKGCGMCYPICGMVHITEPLLLIGKSSHVAQQVFSHYLNGHLPYVQK